MSEVTENNRLKARIEKLEAENKSLKEQCDYQTDKRMEMCTILGVDFCCEEPETCEQVASKLLAINEAMRHDLVASQNLWCTDVTADGKKLPHGFILHHESLGA